MSALVVHALSLWGSLLGAPPRHEIDPSESARACDSVAERLPDLLSALADGHDGVTIVAEPPPGLGWRARLDAKHDERPSDRRRWPAAAWRRLGEAIERSGYEVVHPQPYPEGHELAGAYPSGRDVIATLVALQTVAVAVASSRTSLAALLRDDRVTLLRDPRAGSADDDGRWTWTRVHRSGVRDWLGCEPHHVADVAALEALAGIGRPTALALVQGGVVRKAEVEGHGCALAAVQWADTWAREARHTALTAPQLAALRDAARDDAAVVRRSLALLGLRTDAPFGAERRGDGQMGGVGHDHNQRVHGGRGGDGGGGDQGGEEKARDVAVPPMRDRGAERGVDDVGGSRWRAHGRDGGAGGVADGPIEADASAERQEPAILPAASGGPSPRVLAREPVGGDAADQAVSTMASEKRSEIMIEQTYRPETEQVDEQTGEVTAAAPQPPASEPERSAPVAAAASPAEPQSTALATTEDFERAPAEAARALTLDPSDPRWALALQPTSQREAFILARTLYRSVLFPKYRSVEAIFAVIEMGRERGISALLSLQGMHVIEGKVELAADMIAALVLRSGKAKRFAIVETTDERAVYEAQRLDDPTPIRVEFTKAHAVARGLWGKGNWAKMPDVMLSHRACTKAARLKFPDVVMGLYGNGEIRERVIEGELVDEAPRGGRAA